MSSASLGVASERVAAGQQHFLDAWVGGDRGNGVAPAIARSGLLGIRKVAAEAVAAVRRAAAGGDQQGAAAVFLDHPGSGPGGAIADRIQAEAGSRLHFRIQRQHLAQQRVMQVAMAHPRHERARHPQRKLRGGGIADRRRLRIQAQQLQQNARIAHGVAPLLLPARRRQGGERGWL